MVDIIVNIRYGINMNDFKFHLRKCRTSKNMTQAELAKESGLTPDWISHFETGKREPSFRNLIKIADALDVPLDDLAGRQWN